MPETCRDIYDNKSQLLHQVGTSRHFHIWCSVTHTLNSFCHQLYSPLIYVQAFSLSLLLYWSLSNLKQYEKYVQESTKHEIWLKSVKRFSSYIWKHGIPFSYITHYAIKGKYISNIVCGSFLCITSIWSTLRLFSIQ